MNSPQPGRPEAWHSHELPASSWKRIDDVCMEFESEWLRGQQPELEHFLGRVSHALQSALFAELLALDIEYRAKAGLHPIQGDYETRFPTETNAIRNAFDTATIPGSENGGDDADHRLPTAELGLHSQYRMKQFHARGGLGSIFLAQDDQLDRVVAVKVSRAGRGRSARGRLEREARITGRLEHPGIVPVYASGTTDDGAPCYVMQFVNGPTMKEAIQEWHTSRNNSTSSDFACLAVRKLLGHFVDVCNTIAYAHERGVLHRDVKPGNIILGSFGETFLLDWGLAKSTMEPHPEHELDLTSPSIQEACITRDGQLIGTPAYASPEQLAGNVDAHSVRSDVYSLGATLFCLLTGKSPHEAESVSAALPHPPAPVELDAHVPGPLNSICRKAMDMDPGLRYASATDMAHDIERYLADQPIGLYSEPWYQRTSRWIRHHPRIVAGLSASLVVLCLSLLIGSSLIGNKNRELLGANHRLTQTQGSLLASRKQTLVALSALTDNAVERWLAESGSLDPVEESFIDSILLQYEGIAGDPSDADSSLPIRIEGYFRVGQLNQVLGRKQRAIEAWGQGLRLSKKAKAPLPARTQSSLTRMRSTLGVLVADTGDRGRALTLIATAIEGARQLVTELPTDTRYRMDLAGALDQQGNVHHQRGEYRKSLTSFRQALNEFEKLSPESIRKVPLYGRQWAATLHNCAGTLICLDEHRQAESLLVRSLERYENLESESGRLVTRIDHCRVLTTLGSARRELGKLDQAETHFDLAIGNCSRLMEVYPALSEPVRLRSMARLGLALTHKKVGDLDQAFLLTSQCVHDIQAAMEMAPREMHYRYSACQAFLQHGHLATKLGREEVAAEYLQRAWQQGQELLAQDDQLLHRMILVSALVSDSFRHYSAQDAGQAIDLAQQGIALAEAIEPATRPAKMTFELVGCHQVCGWTYLATRRPEQAMLHWNRVIEITQDYPIVLQGEDIATSAHIYLANCQAFLDPELTERQVRKLAGKDDLTSLQVFSLACAAATASKSTSPYRDQLEGHAFRLLQRAARAGHFREPGSDQILRTNHAFKHLMDRKQVVDVLKQRVDEDKGRSTSSR